MTARPMMSPDSEPLWNGYTEGEIRLPRCVACGHCHLPPGPVCPICFGDELTWHVASGCGVVSTWVVVRRKYFEDFDPPYVVVQVELEEGPRLTANMPIDDLPSIRIGLPVVATFELAANGMVLPLFHPADGAADDDSRAA